MRHTFGKFNPGGFIQYLLFYLPFCFFCFCFVCCCLFVVVCLLLFVWLLGWFKQNLNQPTKQQQTITKQTKSQKYFNDFVLNLANSRIQKDGLFIFLHIAVGIDKSINRASAKVKFGQTGFPVRSRCPNCSIALSRGRHSQCYLRFCINTSDGKCHSFALFCIAASVMIPIHSHPSLSK